MTPENLEKELKQGNLHSIYLFYGEETYLLENAVKKIKKIFGDLILGINYIQINETNANGLISDIETPPFGYDKKLIIVKNSGIIKKEKKESSRSSTDLQKRLSEYIKENIKTINQTTVLIFIEEELTKCELTNTIQELGEVCNFEKLKPLELKKRLKSICNMYQVNIDENTLQFFIETCGTNMQVLINEIRKLIEYAGKNGTIKKEDIDKLSIKELENRIFDLTDNLGKRDITKALEILKELLYNKEPIQKILITLYNHLKKLYIVKLSEKYNKNISESLKLKPNQMFLVTKYKKQAEFFKVEELRKILQELIDLDYNYKNGLIDVNIGLEAILCTYC
ncbi:MAG: DNA polymerase III subunit delta [Clostridia bacterium]